MMFRRCVIALLYCVSAGAQVRHWTQTPTETIWRNLYVNCDQGYTVELPRGVVAHSVRSPNPNHGFVISAGHPGATGDIRFENQRVVNVYDESASIEGGGGRVFLERELKSNPNEKVVDFRETLFQGLPAIEARFQETAGGSSQAKVLREKEQLIVLRRSQGLIYTLSLETRSEYFLGDSALFASIQAGFRVLPLPKGQCSNQ